MSAILLQNGKQAFTDENGHPLVGGLVYFYAPATSTPKDTWQDAPQTVLNTNPVVLDARGEAGIYGSGSYRQVLKAANGDLIWDAYIPDLAGSLQAAIDDLYSKSEVQVDNIAALRLLSKLLYRHAATTGYRSKGDGGEGSYYYDAADTSTADNGFTVIVAADGGRWKLNQAGPFTIKQAGALAGVFDAPTQTINNAAFLAARDWVAANTVRNQLVFTAGIYAYSVSPNWAIQDSQISFEGEVRLRYFGTGNAVILDAGPLVGDLVYNQKFGAGNQVIVECPATALDAVFVRSVHHSKIGVNPRGAGTAHAGLNVQFAVCTQFDVTCSVNEEGWYLGAKPAVGIKLDQRLANETTSYCSFPNPIIEGPDVGVDLISTLGNNFDVGTVEACAQYGVYAQIGASGDRFRGTDFEANGIADVYSLGSGIEVNYCDSDKQINFGATASLCRIIGGRHKSILIDVGAAGCSATDTIYNRSNNGGTFSDGGTNSVVRGVRNGGNNVLYLTGSAAYDPLSIAAGSILQVALSVPGAKLGDKAEAAFSIPIGGLTISAAVSAADTLNVVFTNLTGSPVDLAAGTLSGTVRRGN